MDDATKKEVKTRQDQAKADLLAVLQTIYEKSPTELTPQDKEFLYARRDVIGREKREEYKDVFKEVERLHAVKAKAEQKPGDPAPQEEANTNPHPSEQTGDDGEDEQG